jgi:uncharacterized membrane protein YjjP (DUF1212 family)
MKFYTQKKKKTEEITNLNSSQRMTSKTNKIIMKKVQEVSIHIEDNQIELENLENEISRVK